MAPSHRRLSWPAANPHLRKGGVSAALGVPDRCEGCAFSFSGSCGLITVLVVSKVASAMAAVLLSNAQMKTRLEGAQASEATCPF